MPEIVVNHTMISLVCEHCGKQFERRKAEHDYRIKKGITSRVMCSMKCSGQARKDNRTIEQKRADKAAYDREHRKKPEVKAKHLERAKAFWKSDAGKAKRKARLPLHLEYCRRPEYKEKKKEYDQQYRAEKMYGSEFAEAYLTLLRLDQEIGERMSNHEIRLINDTYNKKQRRRKDYERTNSYELEDGPMGNLERD